MSKLKCPCGYVIADQTNNLPYKGQVLPNKELDALSTILTNSIDSLSEATKSGKRSEWIKTHFNVPPYPLDIKDSAMIFDIHINALIDKTRLIYECESCGRIAIQIGKTERFKFFSPDSNGPEGSILK